MSLSKELLLLPEMEEVLNTLEAHLGKHDGLLPSQFEEEDLLFLYELAYHLYEAGDFTKAGEVFQRLVIAKPFESRYWQGFASSLQMQQRYEEALIPWSMWCLIEENNPLPHFHAGEALLSLGRKEEGLQALQAAENRDSLESLKDKIGSLRLAWGTHDKD